MIRKETNKAELFEKLFNAAAKGATEEDILSLLGGYLSCILLLFDERKLIRGLYIPPEKETDYDSLGWRHIQVCKAPSLSKLLFLNQKIYQNTEPDQRPIISEKEIQVPLSLQGKLFAYLLFKHPRNHFPEKDREEILSLTEPLEVILGLTQKMQLLNVEKTFLERVMEGNEVDEKSASFEASSSPLPPEFYQGSKKILYLLPLPYATANLQDVLLRRLSLIFSQTGVITRYQDALILVTEGEEPYAPETRQTLSIVLKKLGTYGLEAGSFTDWQSLPSRVDALLPVLSTMKAPSGTIENVNWGTFQLLKQTVAQLHLGPLHQGLPLVKEYDQQNGTELTLTLKTYLRQGCHAKETAKLLFVHRNTLTYRLQKAEEIGGFDLTNPDDAFLLRLSLELEMEKPS